MEEEQPCRSFDTSCCYPSLHSRSPRVQRRRRRRRWYRRRQRTSRSVSRGTTSTSRAGPRPTSRPCKEKLDELGAEYISTDAGSSADQQLTDVENLITQGADVLDHPRPGRHRDPAGRPEGDRPGHPGHRLRPADRGPERLLPDLRQRRGRSHAGPGHLRPGPQGQLRVHQGQRRPTPTPTSCAAARRRSCPRRPGATSSEARRATSSTSASPTRTTGTLRTPRRTWSSS